MERSSRQRDAIRSAVDQAGRPLSPAEILTAAQQEIPTLGIATVYRNLKQLQDDGQLQAVVLPGQPPRYEGAAHGHHHHFHCTGCDRVFDIHACPGNIDHLAPPGFSVARHDITLVGLCADCTGAARPGHNSPAHVNHSGNDHGHDHGHEGH